MSDKTFFGPLGGMVVFSCDAPACPDAAIVRIEVHALVGGIRDLVLDLCKTHCHSGSIYEGWSPTGFDWVN